MSHILLKTIVISVTILGIFFFFCMETEPFFVFKSPTLETDCLIYKELYIN